MRAALLTWLLSIVFVLTSFLAQTPQPSPIPSASGTPQVSPTPSPSRSPSPTPLPGAQNFHQWGSITVFNGLPSDSVRAIAQTPDGVMWFGTDNGLARFDGRRVQNFSLGGAETNGVLALKVLSSGELWIGTRKGLFVYSGNTFQPIGTTSDYGITTIFDAGEELLLGTDAGLILTYVLNGSGGAFARPKFMDPLKASDGSVVSITGIALREHKIIVSTSGRGLYELFDRLIDPPIQSRNPSVHAIELDAKGTLWLGTTATKGMSGVYIADGSNPPIRVVAPTADVISLEANDSGVWAGTERYGLFHFVDGKLKKNYTFENTSGGLRSNTIFTIFTDREGVVWIGTNRGVSRFDSQGAAQETVSDIPNSNFIRTIYQSPGESRLLYAGSNRGLFLRDHREPSWTEIPAFKNNAIYAVRKSFQPMTLVGTPFGMFDVSGKKLFDGDVRGFAGFNLRDYAAVFGRGIVVVNGDSARLAVPNGGVTSAAEYRNQLWIGTIDGSLISYDGESVKKEIGPEVLQSGTIWKISAGGDNALWIAGQHGVFRVSSSEAERIIQAEDVRDVLATDDELWAATTTRGLLHARHDDRFGWLVATVGFEQGLPSEKAFGIVRSDEGFLIATNRGLVTYKPGRIAPKLIPVRVLSQRSHDLAELASTIALEYPQNSLLVEVAGQSSRTFPEEFQYAFLLKNSKGEEVARQLSNDPQYAPADLKPGEYTIESIAFNRDLLASEPLTIRFSIAKAPFPWTATALGALLAIALIGLIWAIVEHRRMTQRNRELAAARLDLANEAERERRRIARDLHDQTLADLRNLMIASDKLVADNGAFRSEIEAVSTEIRRICEDLSPSVLENVGLVAALEFLLDRTVETRRFDADDGLEDRIKLPLNVQLQIYRIAQEVLTNIVRHSDAKLVEMNVEASPAGVFGLTIRDDGGRFQPKGSTHKGRGISNIRSRANLIRGKVEWTESRRGGNVFSLKVGPENRTEH